MLHELVMKWEKIDNYYVETQAFKNTVLIRWWQNFATRDPP